MRAETFETVCSFDPEIDKSKLPLEVFAAHSNERANIDAMRHAFSASGPTIFVIREIPREVWWSFVARGDTELERQRRAFMAGVERVKNVCQRGGTRIGEVSGTDTQSFDGKQFDMMRPRDLALFSPLEIEEIGAVAYAHSFFPPKIANCFALPPTSHRMAVESVFQRAESSPISQAMPNEEPSGQGA